MGTLFPLHQYCQMLRTFIWHIEEMVIPHDPKGKGIKGLFIRI